MNKNVAYDQKSVFKLISLLLLNAVMLIIDLWLLIFLLKNRPKQFLVVFNLTC
jgi:hypothetical protein